ncbi:hypothetical protein C3K47_15615 [Solitalea longa]|uniref:Uncharacterized protein n=1 Tax=Solitalea longa TaxID=2079460 RepID=A0A2S4ZYV5_9SPHI|nr:hypothetical protein C3K47_15615 [Solitalea longa]
MIKNLIKLVVVTLLWRYKNELISYFFSDKRETKRLKTEGDNKKIGPEIPNYKPAFKQYMRRYTDSNPA